MHVSWETAGALLRMAGLGPLNLDGESLGGGGSSTGGGGKSGSGDVFGRAASSTKENTDEVDQGAGVVGGKGKPVGKKKKGKKGKGKQPATTLSTNRAFDHAYLNDLTGAKAEETKRQRALALACRTGLSKGDFACVEGEPSGGPRGALQSVKDKPVFQLFHAAIIRDTSKSGSASLGPEICLFRATVPGHTTSVNVLAMPSSTIAVPLDQQQSTVKLFSGNEAERTYLGQLLSEEIESIWEAMGGDTNGGPHFTHSLRGSGVGPAVNKSTIIWVPNHTVGRPGAIVLPVHLLPDTVSNPPESSGFKWVSIRDASNGKNSRVFDPDLLKSVWEAFVRDPSAAGS